MVSGCFLWCLMAFEVVRLFLDAFLIVLQKFLVGSWIAFSWFVVDGVSMELGWCLGWFLMSF